MNVNVTVISVDLKNRYIGRNHSIKAARGEPAPAAGSEKSQVYTQLVVRGCNKNRQREQFIHSTDLGFLWAY